MVQTDKKAEFLDVAYFLEMGSFINFKTFYIKKDATPCLNPGRQSL